MLKPSYAELMEVMNKDSESDVTSRYTVVIAAAKRARQLIDGDEPMIEHPIEGKPVSTAVEEIREGKIKVVPEGQGTVIMPKKSIEADIKEELSSTDFNSEDENEAEEEVEAEEAEVEDIEETVEEADLDDSVEE